MNVFGELNTGTALIGLGVGMAASGRITGAVPKGEEQAWANEGKQPYSIKIGDTWYSMTRLDPFAMVFGTAANLWRLTEASINKIMAPEEQEHLQATAYDMFSLAVAAAADASLNKAFMQSTKQLVDAISNPERMGEGGFERIMTSQAEKFIPWSSVPNNFNRTETRKEYFDAWARHLSALRHR